MIQSFFVYTFLATVLYFLGKYSSKRQFIYSSLGKTASFWEWEVTTMILMFSLISGIRWQVGVDHLTYLNNYLAQKNAGYFLFDKEPGFELITKTFASLDIHFTFYFAFLSFLQIFFIYRAFKNERYLYPFLGILIIFGPHYLSWMNGIRQMIVAAAFIYSIKFIMERKSLKFFALIALCTLIHQSALILSVFYFIPQKNYFRNKWITFLLVGITLVLGNNTFWIESLTRLSELLNFLGYEAYTEEKLDVLVNEEIVRNFGPRSFIILFMALATIWFSPRLKRYFQDSFFITYYNISITGILLFNLFLNTPHIFLRPITYFTIFSLVTGAYLLYYLKKHLNHRNLVPYFFIFIIFLAYLPVSIVADTGLVEEDYTNYKFFWHYKGKY